MNKADVERAGTRMRHYVAIWAWAASTIALGACSEGILLGSDEWKATQYTLSKSVLSFELPQKHSADFFKYRTKHFVDINDTIAYQGSSSILVDQDYWDYFQFLHLFPDGTLQYQLLLRVAPPGARIEAKNLQSVGAIAMAQRNAGRVKLQSQHPAEKIPVIPIANDWAVEMIGVTSWFKYRTIESSPSHCYVVPLDDSHYIELVFSFIDNTMGKDQGWHRNAERDVRRILESARISVSS